MDNKLILESIIGCSSSFNASTIYRKIAQKQKQPFIEKECCIMKIKSINIDCYEALFIIYQNNIGITHFTNISDMELENPLIITNFYCKDSLSIHIFTFNEEGINLYHKYIFPCSIKKENQLAFENDSSLFPEGNELILFYEIYNLKKLHYSNYTTKETQKMEFYFNNEIFMTESKCILCFRKCIDHLSMIIHFLFCHFHYKIKVENDKEIIYENNEFLGKKRGIRSFCRGKTALFYNLSKNVVSHLINLEHEFKKSEKIKFIILENEKTPSFKSKTSFFIMNKVRKIGNPELIYSFKYDYCQEETFAPLDTPIIKHQWINFFIYNKIEEIIDLSSKHIELINQWNCFIFNKRVSSSNIIHCISDFIKRVGPSFELFEMLTAIKRKCVISEDELREILIDLLL